jgi:hypothetical protein
MHAISAGLLGYPFARSFFENLLPLSAPIRRHVYKAVRHVASGVPLGAANQHVVRVLRINMSFVPRVQIVVWTSLDVGFDPNCLSGTNRRRYSGVKPQNKQNEAASALPNNERKRRELSIVD